MKLILSTLIVFIHTLLVLALPTKEGSDPNSAKKYLVSDLPGLHENITPDDSIPLMFAGQLEIYPETDTHYFFWKFSDLNPETVTNRTIFWLNGGPGCSSMDGALLETGPFRINSQQQVISNNGSWHKMGDIIYVDQPAGTGFSYSDTYITDLDQVAEYFLKFMEKYYELFPEEIGYEIYFAGESYAGQYIPYIADAILQRNKKLVDGEHKYDLRGVLIGNGWVSPNEQSLSYLPFFKDHGLIDVHHPKWATLLAKHEQCQKIVNKIDSTFDDGVVHYYEVSSSTCEAILTDLLEYTQDTASEKDQRCVNMYDYTLRDSYPSCGMNWPYELVNVGPFLRQEKVMHQLNLINLKKWNECNGRVGRTFQARHSIPAVHLLPELAKEIPVMLFNGANDIICNSQGVLSYLQKLQWNGETGFTKKDNQISWIYDNKEVGYIIWERNISFINIYNSSHMVPYDLPDVSRALIDLITGKYDEKDVDGKKSFVTYLLGSRKESDASANGEENAGLDKVPGDSPSQTIDPMISSSTASSSSVESSLSSSTASADSDSTSSKFTRLIQLAVILVIFWGVYVLYASYKSRPSSIIKKPTNNTSNVTRSSAGKKKNVQWADQLNQFEDDERTQEPNQGIIAKAIGKITGSKDTRGRYGPVQRGNGNEYIDDIELGEGLSDPNVDEFIIGSDDDEEQGQAHSGAATHDQKQKPMN